MKTLVFKTLFFGLLSILILKFVSDPVFVKRKKIQKHFVDFYNQTEQLDILFLGSSHAENTFNPVVVDSVLLTNSYNLATSGQRLLVTNYLLKEVLQKMKPKMVVLEIFPGSISEINSPRLKGAQLRVFDFTKTSFNKLKIVNKIYDYDELPSVYSETIRNHDVWYEGNWLFKNNNSLNEFKGFNGLDGELEPDEQKKYANYLEKHNNYLKIPYLNYQVKSFEKSTLDIKETIDICKDNDIKLVFVTAPYLPSFYNDNKNREQLLLNEYLKNTNVEHFDINAEFSGLGLTLKDFKNKGHLNFKGAKKASLALAKYLSDQSYFEIKNQHYFSKYYKETTPVLDKQPENVDINIVDQVKNFGVTYDLNHSFRDIITIEKANFYINDTSRYVVLEYKPSANADLLYDCFFFLSSTIYKSDFNKRPKWNLSTNKDKLLWVAHPKSIKIDTKNYLILKLDRKCSIDQFKEFKIDLKNKATKKSVADLITLDSIKLRK